MKQFDMTPSFANEMGLLFLGMMINLITYTSSKG
jgi:hypothetical protein